MQLNHYNTPFKEKQFPIVLVCDNISNAPNIGSLFRISDAFGIEKIVFCGNHIVMGRKVSKTSRATENYVTYSIEKETLSQVEQLKKVGYKIIALEITNTSKALDKTVFSKKTPIALIIGDENFGVSEAILNISDEVIHIEMFGKNSSMNVVQAANIALYEITKQLNQE